MVLRNVLVRDPRPQVGELQTAHLFPVHHVGEQLDPALLHDLFDVVDGNLAVPAGVDVYGEDAEVSLCHLQRQIARVDAATEPEDAVVLLAGTIVAHLGHDGVEHPFAVGVGVPRALRQLDELVAVVADTVVVEHDVGVTGVHDAPCADRILTHRRSVTQRSRCRHVTLRGGHE